jgi:cytochrome c551/c552
MDANGPSVILTNKMVTEAYPRPQNRGEKVKLITEISKGNIDHWKEIMIVAELRHLDGIKEAL